MFLRMSVVVVAFALTVAPFAASAATIHVPDDQPTIQAGLSAASAGDTVLVEAGTYTGAGNRDLDFGGEAVVLSSVSGEYMTTIDCEDAGRGFFFHSGEDTTALVEGFTIANAAADSGAAVMCRTGSSPKFLHCNFQSNAAVYAGGAVCCLASSPIFWFCAFSDNTATGDASSSGGAVACLVSGDPVFRGCTFTGNAGAAYGGAVYAQGCTPRFSNCSFIDGIAAYGGGGAFLVACPSATFTDCVFTGNSGSQGGAIYTQSAPVTATGCLFSEHGQRAVCFLYGSSDGHLDNCTFANNVSHFHSFLGADALLSNCTFVGATSTYAAVTVSEASPTFEYCIMAFSASEHAVVCDDSLANPIVNRCVLYANGGGNELCGTVGDTLHRDPRFCDMAEYEFDLCDDSPCLPTQNTWGVLVGAEGGGCPPCGSAVEATTWGAIKALYR